MPTHNTCSRQKSLAVHLQKGKATLGEGTGSFKRCEDHVSTARLVLHWTSHLFKGLGVHISGRILPDEVAQVDCMTITSN